MPVLFPSSYISSVYGTAVSWQRYTLAGSVSNSFYRDLNFQQYYCTCQFATMYRYINICKELKLTGIAVDIAEQQTEGISLDEGNAENYVFGFGWKIKSVIYFKI